MSKKSSETLAKDREYHRDPEVREKEKAQGRKKRVENRALVLQAYGNRCACPGCGESHVGFLVIDHVNGDGAAHRQKIGGGGSVMYHWLIKHDFPKKGFQILCANCNMAKGIYGKCPHETERSGETP